MGRRGGGNTRTASPRASSPVRSAPRASSPPPSSQQRSFAAPPPRPAAGGPTAGGNAPPMGPGMHPPPSQGPGLMGQMAATAGGVAIGSAVGHAVGNMFTGSSHGSSESAPLQESSPVQTTGYGHQQQQQPMQLCEVEWRQLVECTQKQSDLGVCQAFQDLFRDCKMRNGIN
jgi:hypothetical protein